MTRVQLVRYGRFSRLVRLHGNTEARQHKSRLLFLTSQHIMCAYIISREPAQGYCLSNPKPQIDLLQTHLLLVLDCSQYTNLSTESTVRASPAKQIVTFINLQCLHVHVVIHLQLFENHYL